MGYPKTDRRVQVLVLYDADNGFSAEQVLREIARHPPGQTFIGVAGGPLVAQRLAAMAAGLSPSRAHLAEIRMVLSGPDAADDALVDMAIRRRARTEDPVRIIAFTHDKRLLARLHAIAELETPSPETPVQVDRPTTTPAPVQTPPVQKEPIGDAAFFSRFLRELRPKENTQKIKIDHPNFARCACYALALVGQSKKEKAIGYADAIARLKRAELVAKRTTKAPFNLNVAKMQDLQDIKESPSR